MSEAGVTQSIRYCGACLANTGALLRRACTVHVLERPASASRRAADVTDVTCYIRNELRSVVQIWRAARCCQVLPYNRPNVATLGAAGGTQQGVF